MKKLALAVIATAFIAIGHTPVSAQELPVECGEDSEFVGTQQDCIDFYRDVATTTTAVTTTTAATTTTITQVGAGGPTTTAPPTATTAAAPATATRAATTTTIAAASPAQGALPRTGGGISPLLGIGAALFVGGGITVVATRRRSTAGAN